MSCLVNKRNYCQLCCPRLHPIFSLCLGWGGTSQEVAVPGVEGCHKIQSGQGPSWNSIPCMLICEESIDFRWRECPAANSHYEKGFCHVRC